MKRAGRVAAITLIFVSYCFITVEFPDYMGSRSSVAFAQAEENWKSEFEEVCGKTEESMSMSRSELKALMEKCDKLKPILQMQEEPARKIYLKRLQMCRDLLAYVYESKEK